MGKPENQDVFEIFSVDDILIYIDKAIIKDYLKDNKLLINIEGYGRQNFEIENKY